MNGEEEMTAYDPVADIGESTYNRWMSAVTIGNCWAEPFGSSPFRLRFELGGETDGVKAPVPRFLQAFGRARTVVDDTFLPSECVLAVVGCWPQPTLDLFAPAADGFGALGQAGFTATPVGEWKGPHPRYGMPDDDEEQKNATWKAYDITEQVAARDVIIWCAVAYEMAVTPKAPVVSFMVDLQRGILVHVYDDRGMDVIALKRDPLAEIYRTRNEWLLDHDRGRMIEAFGGPL